MHETTRQGFLAELKPAKAATSAVPGRNKLPGHNRAGNHSNHPVGQRAFTTGGALVCGLPGAFLGWVAGTVKIKVEPSPGLLFAVMSPP